jgi:hypothetical protein
VSKSHARSFNLPSMIQRILEHLGLWAPEPPERAPPVGPALDPVRPASAAFAITPAA